MGTLQMAGGCVASQSLDASHFADDAAGDAAPAGHDARHYLQDSRQPVLDHKVEQAILEVYIAAACASQRCWVAWTYSRSRPRQHYDGITL
jgi:hypothetical protein